MHPCSVCIVDPLENNLQYKLRKEILLFLPDRCKHHFFVPFDLFCNEIIVGYNSDFAHKSQNRDQKGSCLQRDKKPGVNNALQFPYICLLMYQSSTLCVGPVYYYFPYMSLPLHIYGKVNQIHPRGCRIQVYTCNLLFYVQATNFRPLHQGIAAFLGGTISIDFDGFRIPHIYQENNCHSDCTVLV